METREPPARARADGVPLGRPQSLPDEGGEGGPARSRLHAISIETPYLSPRTEEREDRLGGLGAYFDPVGGNVTVRSTTSEAMSMRRRS